MRFKKKNHMMDNDLVENYNDSHLESIFEMKMYDISDTEFVVNWTPLTSGYHPMFTKTKCYKMISNHSYKGNLIALVIQQFIWEEFDV